MAGAFPPALPGGLDAALQTIPLDSVPDALAALPAAGGVVQFLAAGEKNLLIGRAANVRKWAATHLGAGPAPKPGQRPPLDLRPVAVALRAAGVGGEFQQRLLFERLMARYVPLSSRRDVKPPAWLHLDVGARFPRLIVRGPRAARGGGPLFGPFRDTRAAGRARDDLQKRLPLRPCEYDFEPHPELPLGLGCVFAQTRTCAAPCLERTSEDDYRALARRMEAILAGPRLEDDTLPPWVAAAATRAAVVDPLRDGTLELYPVRAGRVFEERALRCPPEGIDAGLAALAWPEAEESPAPDWPWLVSWLHAPRRKGRYVVIRDEAASR